MGHNVWKSAPHDFCTYLRKSRGADFHTCGLIIIITTNFCLFFHWQLFDFVLQMKQVVSHKLAAPISYYGRHYVTFLRSECNWRLLIVFERYGDPIQLNQMPFKTNVLRYGMPNCFVWYFKTLYSAL